MMMPFSTLAKWPSPVEIGFRSAHTLTASLNVPWHWSAGDRPIKCLGLKQRMNAVMLAFTTVSTCMNGS
eukprot:3049432-Pyramimonas_sp.AAC.1